MSKLSHLFRLEIPFGDDAWGIKALDGRISNEMINESLAEAAEPLRQQMQENLEAVTGGPYSTGETAEEGVRIQVLARVTSVIVGLLKSSRPTYGRAFIGYWLEYGIPSRGIAPRPWKRPAENAELPYVPKRFCAALRERLGFNV